MPQSNRLDGPEVRRRLLGGESVTALAAEYGVCPATISYHRRVAGLPPTVKWWKVDPALVRELHAAGRSDQEIAGEIGAAYFAVRRARQRLGLPALGKKTERYRTLQKANFARRQAANGCGLRGTAKAREGYERNSRALAESYGLPPDLRRVQVRVLIALSAGPLHSDALADACDRGQRQYSGYHRFNQGTVPGGNYLADLRRRGLIAQSRRGRRSVYFLTPVCIDLLAAAGGKEKTA